MESATKKKPIQETKPSFMNKTTRRGFAKKLAGIGMLSGMTTVSLAKPVSAWLDGGLQERKDMEQALKVLIKTYGDTRPYPHKFNDALVKAHLRNLDFAIAHGLEKEWADHEAEVLGAVFERHINPAIQKTGQKDMFLWGIFERTSCSYQLYEHINVKDGERTFPCPYKPILGEIKKGLGTYKITWNDVCAKWCTLRWEAFSKKAGDIKFKVEPGDTCRVYIA
jgi:hypothetical protein